jgi:predicted transcriptional regulator
MKYACEQMAERMPALRSALARKLSDQGMPQTKIAELLGITQAAVSQYLSNIRGKQLLRNPKIEHEINKLVKRIIEEKRSPNFCELCLCAKKF